MTDELRIDRLIDAPPEVVFDAFTAEDGRLAFCGHDGPSRARLFHHRHVFEVIDPPRRILLATTERRPDGSSFDFTIEFTFEAQDGKTLMTIIQSGLPSDELREEHDAESRAASPDSNAPSVELALRTRSDSRCARRVASWRDGARSIDA
jgi:uncharacterized protein YndB with AHSA1/START domain